MPWLRDHPYSVMVTVVALLFFVGLLIVERRAPASVAVTQSQGWINPDAPTGYASQQTIETPNTPAPQTPSIGGTTGNYHFISPFSTNSNASPVPNNTQITPDTSDVNTILALISAPSTMAQSNTTANSGASTLADAYSYLPSGIITIATSSVENMTPTQRALYDYGNQLGGVIVGFGTSHPNQVQVLQDFANDRTNLTKITAMKKLGADFSAFGDIVAAVSAPAQMQSAQATLAASYRDIGTKLAQVADADQSDATLMQAMFTYDHSAEKFTQSFLSIVDIFQANGVKFSNSDKGSIFMFPSGDSL